MPVKAYPYNSKAKLSTHFSANEFKCKCGGTHPIYISTELIDKLEVLYDAIGAKRGVVSSGYRCAKHDRNVGGSGGGMHTKGYAVDIVFYNDKNRVIDSRLISCVAQDLGFKGIANITKFYTYIHLDMGNRIYRGNEMPDPITGIPNYNTVTDDFYKYYRKTKEDIKEAFGNIVNVTTENKPINSKDKNVKFTWTYRTSKTIKELQKILNAKGGNLVTDGVAGDKTYAELKKYTITKGDRGPLVAWVQSRLAVLGFKPGIADGIAGINTMNAIKAFQKKNKLGQGYLGGTDWYYLIK